LGDAARADEVELAILETNGEITVVKRGER
jgi:uncharacterized membrane protein YcaP (DUF421 family)